MEGLHCLWDNPWEANNKQIIFFEEDSIGIHYPQIVGFGLSLETPESSGPFWMMPPHHTRWELGIAFLPIAQVSSHRTILWALPVVKVVDPYQHPPGSHTEAAETFSVSAFSQELTPRPWPCMSPSEGVEERFPLQRSGFSWLQCSVFAGLRTHVESSNFAGLWDFTSTATS